MPGGMGTSPVELGLIGFLLMLIWKVLDVGKQLFLSKRGASQFPVPPACIADPLYGTRIQSIHAYTEATQKMIDGGAFNCQWKDRDEVRDLMECLRELVKATKENTYELRRRNNGTARA